jgi:hypothetical protein
VRKYRVKAYGKESFMLSPKIGHIETPQGGKIEYSVKVEYFTGKEGIIKFNRIKTSLDNLTVGNVNKSVTEEDKYKVYNFEIPLIYEAPNNLDHVIQFEEKIDIVLDTLKDQKHIPFKLSGRIGTEPFILIPEKLFVIASESEASIKKKAKLEFNSPIPVKSIQADLNTDLPFIISSEKIADNTFMLTLVTQPEKLQTFEPGMHKANVSIIPEGISGPNMSINLPVSLFIRENI